MSISAQTQLIKSRGFTLVELMIVIAIIAIITGITIPNFNNYIEQQNIRQSQDALKSAYRSTQTKALNNVQSDIYANPSTYWGIGFKPGETRYKIFVTDSTQSGLPANCSANLGANWSSLEKGEALPGGVEFKDNICVYFSFENGNGIGASTSSLITNPAIRIGYPGATGNNCFTVSINEVGTVFEGGPVGC